MRSLFLHLFVIIGLCTTDSHTLQAQEDNKDSFPVIPYPVSVTGSNDNFLITRETTVTVQAPAGFFENEQRYLQTMLRKYLGQDALKQVQSPGHNTIMLRQETVGQEATGPNAAGREAYHLTVDKNQVVLTAATPAGLFYAIQTLRQLLPAAVENEHGDKLLLRGTVIRDEPAFPWRGMQLDVSRHFFSLAYLKKYIDRMAFYKLNKLHLHLTDDQGWRIEIKKYPRLTSESAWRTFNSQDSECLQLAKETGNPDFNIDPQHIRIHDGKKQYGGFYTQAEMKDMIRYAAARHIEIIPEIDMPGHMMAAIALYPELTCDDKPGGDGSHGFSTPICPCKESTLEFAKDIFTEIADLFPSRYIHIGGDEVERSHWKGSPLCQAFMTAHHIASLEGLQSYFNDYMQAFFRQKGKTLVGWDEIVEGGIDSSAVVMFWRPWARLSPLKAAANGNKVIMTPDGPLYFDAFPDKNTLSAVYHYNPTDTMYEMNSAQQKNIIGIQANLWSEHVPSEARADYMIMPRMSALAELGWTHRDLYESYLLRLTRQYQRLDRLHINYRLPDLPDVAEKRVFVDTTSFMVRPPIPGLTIHYTMDNSFPTLSSPVLTHPLIIGKSLSIKLAAFTSSGRRGDIYTVVFDHQSYASPVSGTANLSEGLFCEIRKGSFSKTTGINGNIDQSLILTAIGLPPGMPSTGFSMKLNGYIDVPETGIYTFFLRSDDGSVLHIASRAVVDNDGLHSSAEKGGQVALTRGLHIFSLDYIDGGGGSELGLFWSLNGAPPQPMPPAWLKHAGR
jgi:hexosaminidase